MDCAAMISLVRRITATVPSLGAETPACPCRSTARDKRFGRGMGKYVDESVSLFETCTLITRRAVEVSSVWPPPLVQRSSPARVTARSPDSPLAHGGRMDTSAAAAPVPQHSPSAAAFTAQPLCLAGDAARRGTAPLFSQVRAGAALHGTSPELIGPETRGILEWRASGAGQPLCLRLRLNHVEPVPTASERCRTAPTRVASDSPYTSGPAH